MGERTRQCTGAWFCACAVRVGAKVDGSVGRRLMSEVDDQGRRSAAGTDQRINGGGWLTADCTLMVKRK